MRRAGEGVVEVDNVSLREFYVQRRFGTVGQDGQITDLEDALRASDSGKPRLVVVHSSYAKQSSKKVLENGDEQATSAHWGRGVGRTALLEAFVKRAPVVAKCEILHFPDIRRKLPDWGRAHFFDHFLVEQFLTKQEDWKRSLHYHGRSVMKRLRILMLSWVAFVVALTVFAGALAEFTGISLKDLLMPSGEQLDFSSFLLTLAQYPGWTFVAVLVILVIGLLLSWAALPEGKRAKWQESAPGDLMERAREERRNQLLDAPQYMAQLLSAKRCWLLIVDDVDHIDSTSIELILEFFKAAEQDNRRVCVVLAYNPMNPLLYRLPEKDKIRDLLSEDNIKNKRPAWKSVPLTPLDRNDLIGMLHDYFDSDSPEELIRTIEKKYPDVSADMGQLLQFFGEKLDASRLETIEQDELIELFDSYMRDNEIEVKQVLKEIEEEAGKEGSLEFLKFMLAFQTDSIPEEALRKLLDKEGYYDLGLYERVLRKRARLIVKETVQHHSYYRFRDPYWRYRLSTSWTEWDREEEADYCARVFDSLYNDKSYEPELRWNPEQALKGSSLSTEAIEVLYSEGLYYYQFYGHSDAGYALRFLGWEEGGALDKWLALCKRHDGEKLWDLVYWERKTFRDELRRLRTHRLRPKFFSAPDLVVNAATAYWITGRTNEACHIIEEWKTIRDRLLSNPPARKKEKYKVPRDLLHTFGDSREVEG